MAAAPLLACVVLGHNNEPTLPAAVRSLIEQDPPVETVVVNSGEGGATEALKAAGLDVPVLEFRERLFPGGARNRGVEATRAPYVSFLAADCVAYPGWSANRLRRHEAGAAAVASALVNSRPDSRAATAAFLLLFHRRLPGAPLHARKLYGVSYSRALLKRFGPFPEELRAGEDTAVHRRFEDFVPIAWGHDVLTGHGHPDGVRPFLREQYVRGKRMALVIRTDGWSLAPGRLAVSAMRNAASAMWSSWRYVGPDERRRNRRCWPLLPLGAAAYAIGVLGG